MAKKVAQIIVETLAAAGVKHCYGIVGDTLNLIAHHINESDIEWVHVYRRGAGGGCGAEMRRKGSSDGRRIARRFAAEDCALRTTALKK